MTAWCRWIVVAVVVAETHAVGQDVPVAHDVDLERSVIRAAPPGRYAMYGGLTRLADGEVSCVFKVGSLDPKTRSPWTVRDETIVVSRSTGGGRAWPPTETIIYRQRSTRQENCCGTGYQSSDGTLRHAFYILNADYEERAQVQNWSHVQLAESADGARWTVRRLDVPLAIAASFGGMLRLDDGTLLLGVYGAAQPGTFRHQAGLLRSRDDGRSWGDYTVLGATADPDGGPARLNETSVAQLADGRMVSLSRTQYNGFPLYQGLSADRGRTWTVRPSSLTGLCPTLCFARSGPPEGVLVAVYHDRWGLHQQHGGVYATFSTDGGAHWGLPVRLDGGAYPCAIEIEPGRLLVSYYRDNTRLCAVRFAAPFPCGLQAARPSNHAVTLRWDAYRGPAAGELEYAIHRADRADFSPREENWIGRVRAASSWTDRTPPSGASFYRVVARRAHRTLGVSWLATCNPQ